ncbi:MAG: GxxExxY protein [Patescibacteria group bacterium]
MNDKTFSKIIFPELSYRINGILYKAHNELGRFCNEKQYGDFIEKLLKEEKIKYEREKILLESFDGEHKGRNKLDFIIDDKIILELKAKRILPREDYYQVKRYLEALNLKLALLVNLRDKYLKPRRILNSKVK